MVQNNYTFDGLKVPRFPGGLVPDHTLNGVPEWAYGVTDWFEQGLYLPLYSDASNSCSPSHAAASSRYVAT